MASSSAYGYATGEGGIGLDAYYNNINTFLSNNPDQQAIADAMAQWGVSQEDVDAAKGIANGASNTGALSQATQPAITFTSGLADMGVDKKAQEYATLLSEGYTDAQIKAAADATFGTQTASDWDYLKNYTSPLTQVAGNAATGVLNNAGNTTATGALTQVATGANSGATGNNTGNTATVGANGANALDVANTSGLTFNGNFGLSTGLNLGANTGAALTSEQLQKLITDNAADPRLLSNVMATNNLTAKQVMEIGKLTPEQMAAVLKTQIGDNKETDLFGGVILDTYGGHNVAIVKSDLNNVYNQIIGQGLTNQWKGQGFGSAEANAMDMAKSLVASGVTDINQIAQGTFYVPQSVETRLVDANGQTVEKLGNQYVVPQYATNDNGQNEIVGYKNVPSDQVTKQLGVSEQVSDQNGSSSVFRVLDADQQKKIKTNADGTMTIPVAAGEGIINKTTGERILSNYTERTQGNAFGGTYAGSGNTAYRVNFQNGTPVFYTTAASSNDLANILQDNPILNAVANVAANYFLPGYGPALLAAAQGKDIGEVAKAYVLSQAGSAAGTIVGGSESLVNTVGQEATNALANTARSFVSSGGRANVLESLATGGLNAGVSSLLSEIPEFSTLSKANQGIVSNLVTTTLKTGNLTPEQAVNAAFTAATAEIQAQKLDANKVIGDYTTAGASTVTGATGNDTVTGGGGVVVTPVIDGASITGNTTITGDSAATGNNGATTTGNAETTVAGNGSVAASNAQVQGALDDATNIKTANDIANSKTFSEAYSTARNALGSGKVFTWNGKQYSTDSRTENASLAAASDAVRMNNIATSTIAGGGRGTAASYAGYDVNAAANNYANAAVPKTVDASTAGGTTGGGAVNDAVFDQQGNIISGSTGSANDNTVIGRATNAFNNALGYVVQNGLTNLAKAGGEQLAAFGGALATIGLTNADNVLVKAGQAADKFGSSIESAESKAGTQNITNAVSNAEGIGGKLIAGLVAGWNNPTAAVNLITREGLQEILPAGTALGASKILSIGAAAGIDTALNAAESMGSAYNDAYQGAIAKGLSKSDADALATQIGLSAGAITLVTSGAMDAALVKTIFREGSGSLGKQLATGSTKEGISENIEETATALATQFLTTGKMDWDAATTQGAIGHLIGKSTAGTVGATDAALNAGTDTKGATGSVTGTVAAGTNTASTSTADAAATNTINNNITAAVTNGDAAGVNTAITNSVQTSLSGGASVNVAVGNTVTSAITNGADANASITSAVTSAVASGADVKQTVTASVGSAITAGADSTVAIGSTVTSAISSGANSSVVVSSAITSAVTAGADVTTASNAAVTAAVTSAVTTGANTTTAINSSVAAAVTAGANASAAVTTAVTAAVESSVTAAVNSGANISNAVTSSVTSSVNAAATANTSVTSAVETAVGAAVNSAVTNNANVSTAVTSAVTSAITTAVGSNVNASTAVTTAVGSAVTAAINGNVDANTAITNSVTAAIATAVNSSTTTNAAVTTNVNAAVTSAVNAAVTSGVDVNTAITTAVNAAVNATVDTNVKIDIAALTATATSTATSVTEKVDLINSVNDLISGTTTTTPKTTPKTTPTKTTTPTTPAALTAGLMAGVVNGGELGRLSPQMLKAYMTQDKFVDPLAQLHALQEENNPEKMPALPQVNTQETNMPDQGTWKYGNAPDDMDALFGEPATEEAAFKAGGYVSPLQMASGGAMPLPLLVKSGGALGALPRGDGRLDFRHGAHVAGEGDGQSDDIKAMLADGEFVFPADVVSALGNGSTKAGSDKLYEMMHSIRERARSKKPKDLPPPALKSPLDYLKKR